MATALAPTLPVRLSLTPPSTPAGPLDGAWWPRTRDLAAELPPLVDALEGRFGRITRVMVNPARWPVVPHKVAVALAGTAAHGTHTVHVGWFAEQDADKMILLSYAVGRCDLLVVPPGTEPAAARRLMTAAARPGGELAAGALLADEAAAGEDAWETDGGAAPPPVRHPVVGARMIPLPGRPRRNLWKR
ncbi:DUF5994 family protein [Streptomyces sp. NPDC058486]|uniref:DUF5994 family protein n=1 Tax=unclassified Streptomyces TaxID=2593676 RepID=UPI00365A8DC3